MVCAERFNGELVHPEAVDADAVCRRLFGIVLVGPHLELAARDPHHVVEGRRAGRLHAQVSERKRN